MDLSNIDTFPWEARKRGKKNTTKVLEWLQRKCGMAKLLSPDEDGSALPTVEHIVQAAKAVKANHVRVPEDIKTTFKFCIIDRKEVTQWYKAQEKTEDKRNNSHQYFNERLQVAYELVCGPFRTTQISRPSIPRATPASSLTNQFSYMVLENHPDQQSDVSIETLLKDVKEPDETPAVFQEDPLDDIPMAYSLGMLIADKRAFCRLLTDSMCSCRYPTYILAYMSDLTFQFCSWLMSEMLTQLGGDEVLHLAMLQTLPTYVWRGKSEWVPDMLVAVAELKNFRRDVEANLLTKTNDPSFLEIFPTGSKTKELDIIEMTKTFRSLLSCICYEEPSLSHRIISDRGTISRSGAHPFLFTKNRLFAAIVEYLHQGTDSLLPAAALSLSLILESSKYFIKANNTLKLDPAQITVPRRIEMLSEEAESLLTDGIVLRQLDPDLGDRVRQLRNLSGVWKQPCTDLLSQLPITVGFKHLTFQEKIGPVYLALLNSRGAFGFFLHTWNLFKLIDAKSIPVSHPVFDNLSDIMSIPVFGTETRLEGRKLSTMWEQFREKLKSRNGCITSAVGFSWAVPSPKDILQQSNYKSLFEENRGSKRRHYGKIAEIVELGKVVFCATDELLSDMQMDAPLYNWNFVRVYKMSYELVMRFDHYRRGATGNFPIATASREVDQAFSDSFNAFSELVRSIQATRNSGKRWKAKKNPVFLSLFAAFVETLKGHYREIMLTHH